MAIPDGGISLKGVVITGPINPRGVVTELKLPNFGELVLGRPGEFGAPLEVCCRRRRIFQSIYWVCINTHYTYPANGSVGPGVSDFHFFAKNSSVVVTQSILRVKRSP